MKKKELIINIIAWIAIVVGLYGTGVFLYAVYVFFRSLWLIFGVKVTGYAYKGACAGLEGSKLFMSHYWPHFVLFITGLGCLKRKSVWKKIQFILSAVILLLSLEIILTKQWKIDILTIKFKVIIYLIILGLLVMERFFSKRRKDKLG